MILSQLHVIDYYQTLVTCMLPYKDSRGHFFCEVFLLAVDHDGSAPLWFAAATALLDVLDHVREILRFLRQLSARPLQELEVFHRPTLFPLWTENVLLNKLVTLKCPVLSQADAGKYEITVGLCYRCGRCSATLTWRISMLRVMRVGEVSVLATSTSISPNVFLSLSQ